METLPIAIQSIMKKENSNEVTIYEYKGKHVYGIFIGGCGAWTSVYEEDGTYIGAPWGGVTGKGDCRLLGFTDEATHVKTINL